ncbi:MAG TPA: hypothetical protein VJQ09_03710 [Candidatus Limnocylindria bacterium]|nr:hypothetical protein [Candidatus Limnocylindria bacterium]
MDRGLIAVLATASENAWTGHRTAAAATFAGLLLCAAGAVFVAARWRQAT